MNIVILQGRLVAVPTVRELADGTMSWSFDPITGTGTRVHADGSSTRQSTVSVPVTWQGDATPQPWSANAELALAGIVRRRFFRSSGTTQSRTEVLALGICEITKRRPSAKAFERVLSSLAADELAALRFGTAS